MIYYLYLIVYFLYIIMGKWNAKHDQTMETWKTCIRNTTHWATHQQNTRSPTQTHTHTYTLTQTQRQTTLYDSTFMTHKARRNFRQCRTSFGVTAFLHPWEISVRNTKMPLEILKELHSYMRSRSKTLNRFCYFDLSAVLFELIDILNWDVGIHCSLIICLHVCSWTS